MFPGTKALKESTKSMVINTKVIYNHVTIVNPEVFPIKIIGVATFVDLNLRTDICRFIKGCLKKDRKCESHKL